MEDIENIHYTTLLAIYRYLHSDDNLAMQIDGSWGTGKTYYMKHHVFKEMNNGFQGIRATDKKAVQKSQRNQSFVPVYVSLNGLHSVKQIRNKLGKSLILNITDSTHKRAVFTSLDLISNGLSELFSSNKYLDILNSIGITPDKLGEYLEKSLMKSNNNTVLVFDDLERVSMPLETLFGFFSNIMDEFNCHVIIISNENALDENKDNIKKYKEKIIDKTLSFGIDSKQVAINILDHLIPGNYHCRSWILQISKTLITRVPEVNLRTLFSIVYNYKILYKYLLTTNPSVDSKVFIKSIKVGYLSIFSLTDVIKKDKVNKSSIKGIFGSTSIALQNNVNNKNNNYIISKNNYLYNTFFDNASNKFLNNILYTKTIYHLIINDIFSINDFVNAVNKSFYSSIGIIRKEFDYLAENNRFYTLSDSKIKAHESKLNYALNTTNWHNIGISLLINIYTLFNKLNKLDVLFEPAFDDLSDLKNTILDFARSAKGESIKSFSPNSIAYADSDMKQKLEFIYNKKESQLISSQCIKYINSILFSDIGLKNDKEHNLFKHHNRSIFETILNDKHLRQVFSDGDNPKSIFNFIQYLKHIIVHDKNRYKNYSIELDKIPTFKSFIRKLKKRTKSHILSVDLKMLLKTLDEFNDSLNKRGDINH